MRRWTLALLAASASAADPLLILPAAAPTEPCAIAGPTIGEQRLAHGVTFTIDRWVVFTGSIALDQGPADGLEKLACLHFGKVAESLIRLDAEDGVAVKAACIAAFGLVDGSPAEESSQGIPGRGTPVRLCVEWADETHGWWSIDASCLVRDRISDRAYPPLPWVYTGSAFVRNGAHEVFLLDACGTLAATYDEDPALLASPFPDPGRDDRYEVNSRLVPPAGTPVRVVLSPATLPLRLRSDASGNLRTADEATPLDDAGLAVLLGAVSSHAIQILVPSSSPRTQDVLQRQRIIAAAGRAERWITPLFRAAP